ncbi:hypothetical protein BSAE_1899 [Bifidobacterium pullorum subsp. saeculare DSM 6531 = LMG 14934]|uniref:Uncharacterized protein n=1 Tax=Bifidobacterium pullorum subsp. saeculare DSM 6531 = LMG 14934 TaxID=1437611 RepID=A0A087CPX1_9BIFI|nr:hypothetical protein BSAE_1899 [Bifidobacterium pullorum subsp. saeculare DSM 6531 = LMG 14934]
MFQYLTFLVCSGLPRQRLINVFFHRTGNLLSIPHNGRIGIVGFRYRLPFPAASAQGQCNTNRQQCNTNPFHTTTPYII